MTIGNLINKLDQVALINRVKQGTSRLGDVTYR